MPETLSIGSFDCDEDSAWFRIDREGIVGGTGRLTKVRNIWTIYGRVNGTDESSVDTEVVALEAAVVDGIDIEFSLGSTMSLTSDDTTEGTHIKSFSWLTGSDGVRGSGAEGILRRSFKLVVYGDILVASDTGITQWSESLNGIGTGGPNTIPVVSLLGDVQAQTTQARTPCFLIQSGFAVGITETPVAPSPIYYGVPGIYYMPLLGSQQKFTPKSLGINQNTQFGIRWSYKCWSINQLVGSTSLTVPF